MVYFIASISISLICINNKLLAGLAEVIVFRVCANPANKQVSHGAGEIILTYHPKVISANVENNPVTPLPQEIG
jgi:hypothetical protein